MTVPNAYAAPLANLLRAMSLWHRSGVVGVVSSSSFLVNNTSVSAHELLARLCVIEVPVDGYAIKDLHLKAGSVKLKDLADMLKGTIPDNIKDEPFMYLERNCTLSVIIASNDMTRDVLAQNLSRDGKAPEDLLVQPTGFLTSELVNFNLVDQGDGTSEVKVNASNLKEVISTLKALLGTE